MTTLSAAPQFGKSKPSKNQNPWVPLSLGIAILTLLFGAIGITGAKSVKLGLDLRGGSSVLLTPKATTSQPITPEAIADAVSIIRQRVNSLGVAESQVTAQGSGEKSTIQISVPGSNDRNIVAIVGQTALLTFRPVLLSAPSAGQAPDKDSDIGGALDNSSLISGEKKFAIFQCPLVNSNSIPSEDNPNLPLLACNKEGNQKYLLGSTKVLGNLLNSASPMFDQSKGWVSSMQFNPEGQKYFWELTKSLAGQPGPKNQMAVVLDGKVISAPGITGPLAGDNVIIYGNFDQKSATELAQVLKYGSLPLSFVVGNVEQISPTLGSTQFHAGLIAGALGLILVSIFLFVYYRFLGLISVLSLALAGVFLIGLFLLLGELISFTLTLAGIAGAIVSIGVTADSFIVYFEKIRDESRQGKSLRTAVETAWKRAKHTIIAADCVSLIAAVVLYIFSVGEVRGFAFTLGVTTLIDIVIVFLFTKPLISLLAKVPYFYEGRSQSGLSQKSLGLVFSNVKNRKGIRGLLDLSGKISRGEKVFKILDKKKLWFLVSGALVSTSIFSFLFIGLNLGIEFKGGSAYTVPITSQLSSFDPAKNALEKSNYTGEEVIQRIGKDKIQIQIGIVSNEQSILIQQNLADEYKTNIDSIDAKSTGPAWGKDVSEKALLSLIWFIVVISIYLAKAFEPAMAFAALMAVLHDVVITVGIYALTGTVVTPASVVGFLTILGYSLYDTVVVFDKVKENLSGKDPRNSRGTPVELINLALNQTIVRSANTSLVAILPVASILFIGNGLLHAGTLKDLSLSLFVGLLVGTYSSIFLASPILALFKSKSPEVNQIQALHLNSRPMREQFGQQDKFETLEGKKIALEVLKRDHSANLFKYFHNDNEVWNKHFLLFDIPNSPQEMESILGLYIIEKKSSGHELYAVVEEENDQIIGIVDTVVDKVLRKVYIYEVVLSEYLRQSDFAVEIFELLDKKYLEQDQNNYIEINIDKIDINFQGLIVLVGFEETGIVPNAWRNRGFEYCDAKLFTKKNLTT